MTKALRPALHEDLHAIQEVVRDAYTPYIARIGREPAPMLDDYRALIAAGRVHVAEHDHLIKGILVLIPEEEAMLLDNIAVAPLAQGRGIGRKLLEFAEQTAREAGYRVIRLYTNEAMTENLAIYSRLGYVESHRAQENGFKRVHMVKSLD